MNRTVISLFIAFLLLTMAAALIIGGIDRSTSVAAAEGAPLIEKGAWNHVVRPGDTLYSLSERYYGDARLWNALARVNAVENPMRLRVGARLAIPTAVDRAAAIGEYAPMSATIVNGGNADDAGHPPAEAPVLGEAVLRFAARGFLARVSRDADGYAVRFLECSAKGPGKAVAEECFSDDAIFRFLYAKDGDDDGVDELYTVWQRGSDRFYTRVFSEHRGAPALVMTTPEDPWAMAYEARNTR